MSVESAVQEMLKPWSTWRAEAKKYFFPKAEIDAYLALYPDENDIHHRIAREFQVSDVDVQVLQESPQNQSVVPEVATPTTDSNDSGV